MDVELLTRFGEERQRCEEDLAAAGIALPLPYRMAWQQIGGGGRPWFLAVREGGRCLGGMAIGVHRSRALPGHLLLRVERLGATVPGATGEAALRALVDLARRRRRILRINVELFSREEPVRTELGRKLGELGFAPVPVPRSYLNTVAIDLSAEEEQILAGLHPTARRHIRAVARHPVAVRVIEDELLGGRMNQLLRETMARTGGAYSGKDWGRIIAFSAGHPTLSRVTGLFDSERSGARSLLAFAWGCAHGDYVQYDAAASTRDTELRLPMAYGLVWDLLCWARRNGAAWFDFGGITAGHHGEADRLGGISDFKRYFSNQVVRVGEEWVLEVRPIRSSLARTLGACASRLRGLGDAGGRACL